MTRLRLGPVTIHFASKDGGPESHVTGWFIEWKAVATLCLLRFSPGSRDAYHSHAFNCVSVVLRGLLSEHCMGYNHTTEYAASPLPFCTYRSTLHKVIGVGTSWVLSLRGPWTNTWREWVPGLGYRTLGRGRVEL